MQIVLLSVCICGQRVNYKLVKTMVYAIICKGWSFVFGLSRKAFGNTVYSPSWLCKSFLSSASENKVTYSTVQGKE
jgi:hypothetical protein